MGGGNIGFWARLYGMKLILAYSFAQQPEHALPNHWHTRITSRWRSHIPFISSPLLVSLIYFWLPAWFFYFIGGGGLVSLSPCFLIVLKQAKELQIRGFWAPDWGLATLYGEGSGLRRTGGQEERATHRSNRRRKKKGEKSSGWSWLSCSCDMEPELVVDLMMS